MISFVVSGNHMSGLGRSQELVELGATRIGPCVMASCYSFHALCTDPPKPALVRELLPVPGSEIQVEEWSLPADGLIELLLRIEPPQALGRLLLRDGRLVYGFVVEPAGLVGAENITHLNGWRAYLTSACADPQQPLDLQPLTGY